jgi:hypothetical protein
MLKLCPFGRPNFIPVFGDASGIAKKRPGKWETPATLVSVRRDGVKNDLHGEIEFASN